MHRLVEMATMAGMLFAFVAQAQQSSMPAPTAPPTVMAVAGPQAKIDTDLGTIVIALDRAHAPQSVANFIAYARAGHYDGTTIYRVAPGFVIQMGSYEANGSARAVRAGVPLESASGLKNVRGAVAMARLDDPGSATAEFFVDLADLPDLDPKPGATPNTTGYAVFGRVISGMDVADKIAAVPTGGKGPFPPASTPLTPVLIRKVTVIDPAQSSVPPVTP